MIPIPIYSAMSTPTQNAVWFAPSSRYFGAQLFSALNPSPRSSSTATMAMIAGLRISREASLMRCLIGVLCVGPPCDDPTLCSVQKIGSTISNAGATKMNITHRHSPPPSCEISTHISSPAASGPTVPPTLPPALCVDSANPRFSGNRCDSSANAGRCHTLPGNATNAEATTSTQ